VDLWWIAPGVALVAFSFVLRFLHIGLVIAHRPNKPLVLFSLRLRQIGFGLTFLGVGAGIVVRALMNWPDVGSLVVGALIAGIAGLYFISASDPAFRTGVIAVPPRWQHRPTGGIHEETVDAKARRLHKAVHPEEAIDSKADSD
jgi:hypothetical protein